MCSELEVLSLIGGVHNAVTNANKIGCKAFALFLKSQRQWNAKPLEESVIQQFKQLTQVEIIFNQSYRIDNRSDNELFYFYHERTTPKCNNF